MLYWLILGQILDQSVLVLDQFSWLFGFSCSEVLFRELESRQTALRHLIHYLTETRDQRLLLELLRSLLTPGHTCFHWHVNSTLCTWSVFLFWSSAELWAGRRTWRYVVHTAVHSCSTQLYTSDRQEADVISFVFPWRQLLQYKEHLSIADENKRRDFLKSCLRWVTPADWHMCKYSELIKSTDWFNYCWVTYYL